MNKELENLIKLEKRIKENGDKIASGLFSLDEEDKRYLYITNGETRGILFLKKVLSGYSQAIRYFAFNDNEILEDMSGTQIDIEIAKIMERK